MFLDSDETSSSDLSSSYTLSNDVTDTEGLFEGEEEGKQDNIGLLHQGGSQEEEEALSPSDNNYNGYTYYT